MTLAVLIPYRPDSEHRERIHATTARLWARRGVQVVYADDGLQGELFSFARAANRARARTGADVLLTYSVDALPLPAQALADLEAELAGGVPWAAVFAGQHRFTPEQTERLLAGHEPRRVGPPDGDVAMGRTALMGVRADVWDDLRGMDERFVGWGREDDAFHLVLRTLYPAGRDEPRDGLFASLWHPPVTRDAFAGLEQIWSTYQPHAGQPSMREFYLQRP